MFLSGSGVLVLIEFNVLVFWFFEGWVFLVYCLKGKVCVKRWMIVDGYNG